MPTIATTDGTEIFYKDWGAKNTPVIMFHHGWPLSSDDWDAPDDVLRAEGLPRGRP